MVMTAMRLLFCAAATVAIAACGGGASPESPAVRLPQQTGANIGGSTPASGRTLAENKADAARYTSHLLSLVQLPSGAKRLYAAPPNLDDPASGTPSESHADDARYYTIPMSFDDAVSWLSAYRPDGHLRQSGTSGGGGPGYQQSGVDFSGASSPAWQSADLGLIVETDTANTTYLRVDAVVVWLDPVPVRDTSTGPRIHFTVGDGCPANDQHQPDVTNTVDGLDRVMLPGATPIRALLCRFGDGGKLAALRALGAPAAQSAAATIRKVPLSHTDGGSYGCPASVGTEGYAAFDYPGGQTVDIRVDLSGCAAISNGEITAMAGNAGALFDSASPRTLLNKA
jgi:hypothetical protein